jgi:hypothetical protein
MLENSHNDIQSIIEAVTLYFTGTYQGDAAQLRQAFHSDAHITGSIHNQIVDWTLSDFLERVTVKPTALDKDEKYDKKIVAIDATENAAMVKARVVVGDLIFKDYITLLKIAGKWIIRNKSFTNE